MPQAAHEQAAVRRFTQLLRAHIGTQQTTDQTCANRWPTFHHAAASCPQAGSVAPQAAHEQAAARTFTQLLRAHIGTQQ
jgi:hypothetical protein